MPNLNAYIATRAAGLFLLSLAAAATPACASQDGGYLLGAAPQPVVRVWQREARVNYRVMLPAPQTQTVEISVEVQTAGAEQLDFVLPTWRPGRYLVLDFAGALSRVSATDGEGNALPLRKLDKTTWRVRTNAARIVRLRYRIYANELSSRTRHVDDSHAFLSGSIVFMYVRGRRNEPVKLLVDAPPGWRTSTGLDPAPDAPSAFIAPSYDVLIDAPLEIGTHAVHKFEVKDVPYELAVWGGAKYDADELVAEFKTLVAAQVDFWGSVPYGRYVFLLHATSGAGGGTEHLNSTIMQTGRDFAANDKNRRRFLGLVSHEFFHTWNVKALRPAGLSPYDFVHENYTDLLWVAEGTTSYYGPLLLVRAGLKKPKRYLEDLAKSIDSYRKRPGRNVQSLEMSSFDVWTKFNKPSPDAANTTVSFYRKGALVSLLLDLEIRRRSENAGSLDEVLRRLYERFPLSGPGYTRDDLIQTVNEIAGDDLTQFFNRYVAGTHELPFEKLLARAGLELKEEPNKKDDDKDGDDDEALAQAPDSRPAATQPAPQKPDLGLRLRDAGGLARVSGVRSDGPAYDAGVQIDDLIVALNDRRLRAADLKIRLDEHEPGDTVTLTLLRRDVLKQIVVTLAARNDVKLVLERVKEPTQRQRAIYEAWLGQPWPDDK